MPAVRKTTHFTDGALFSSLSHPLFLLPLPGPSPYPLDRFRFPFCFPVLLPGSVSRFRLPVPSPSSSFNPDYYSLSVSLHVSLHVSLPSPSPSPLHLRSIFRSDSRQRHRVLAAKGCIANRKTGITGKILQRHRLFGSKVCIADRKPVITNEKLQRHRVFATKECVADRVGSKECVAWKQCAARDTGGLQAGSMRQTSQQAPPCGISQKDKGCGQGGGRSRRP